MAACAEKLGVSVIMLSQKKKKKKGEKKSRDSWKAAMWRRREGTGIEKVGTRWIGRLKKGKQGPVWEDWEYSSQNVIWSVLYIHVIAMKMFFMLHITPNLV